MQMALGEREPCLALRPEGRVFEQHGQCRLDHGPRTAHRLQPQVHLDI